MIWPPVKHHLRQSLVCRRMCTLYDPRSTRVARWRLFELNYGRRDGCLRIAVFSPLPRLPNRWCCRLCQWALAINALKWTGKLSTPAAIRRGIFIVSAGHKLQIIINTNKNGRMVVVCVTSQHTMKRSRLALRYCWQYCHLRSAIVTGINCEFADRMRSPTFVNWPRNVLRISLNTATLMHFQTRDLYPRWATLNASGSTQPYWRRSNARWWTLASGSCRMADGQAALPARTIFGNRPSGGTSTVFTPEVASAMLLDVLLMTCRRGNAQYSSVDR